METLKLNNLTVTREELGGGKRGRVFRNSYKVQIDKTKEGWNQEREVGMAGVGKRVVRGKCR